MKSTMRRERFFLIALQAIFSVVLVGCGGGTPPQEVQQAGTALEGVEASPGEGDEGPAGGTEVAVLEEGGGTTPEGEAAATGLTDEVRDEPAALPPPDGSRSTGVQSYNYDPRPENPVSRNIADQLIVGGPGTTAAQRQYVLKEMSRLPPAGLQKLQQKGVSVQIVDGPITTLRTDLQDVVPRGWEKTGKSWNDVYGMYDPKYKRVVIGTKDGQVPSRGGLHGSVNVVAHEVGHAIDAATEGHNDRAFLDARTADLAKITPYEKQADPRGALEETYAESLARYVNQPLENQPRDPTLRGYWQNRINPPSAAR